MKRTIVQIARIRLGDVATGDIINGKPDADHGWFPVEMIRELPSGDLVVTGSTNADNVKARPWDLVGVQITKSVDVPEAASWGAPAYAPDLPSPHDDHDGAPERVPATSSA